MSAIAYSPRLQISAEIPTGWHQLSVGTLSVRGDKYLNHKGEWVITMQPGKPVEVWTPYIRQGALATKAARPKAATPVRAARLKGT